MLGIALFALTSKRDKVICVKIVAHIIKRILSQLSGKLSCLMLIVLSVVLVVSACKSKDPVLPITETSPQTPIEADESASPVLTYVVTGENEWELKRLRLSQQGFEVLNERGRVFLEDESAFSLVNATDSFRRDVESREEYLEIAFWSGLKDLLSTDVFVNTQGFLEYYGYYYLVTEESNGTMLYHLGTPTIFDGGMYLDTFYQKALEFYKFIENEPETIYGGDGVNTHNLP